MLRNRRSRRSYFFFTALVDQVQEGGRVKLSTNHIKVGDLDTPRKDLLLWLVNPPKYGHIENTKRGEACLCDLHYLTKGEHVWPGATTACAQSFTHKTLSICMMFDSPPPSVTPGLPGKLALQLQMEVLLLTYIENPTFVCKEKAWMGLFNVFGIRSEITELGRTSRLCVTAENCHPEMMYR